MCVCVCVCVFVCSEVGVEENNDQEIEVFSNVDDDEIERCEIFNISSLRGTKILVDLQKNILEKSTLNCGFEGVKQETLLFSNDNI